MLYISDLWHNFLLGLGSSLECRPGRVMVLMCLYVYLSVYVPDPPTQKKKNNNNNKKKKILDP